MGSPSDQLLHILYGGPPWISFFANYMGISLRSVSRHNLWKPPSDLFFVPYMGSITGTSLKNSHFSIIALKIVFGEGHNFKFPADLMSNPSCPSPASGLHGLQPSISTHPQIYIYIVFTKREYS